MRIVRGLMAEEVPNNGQMEDGENKLSPDKRFTDLGKEIHSLAKDFLVGVNDKAHTILVNDTEVLRCFWGGDVEGEQATFEFQYENSEVWEGKSFQEVINSGRFPVKISIRKGNQVIEWTKKDLVEGKVIEKISLEQAILTEGSSDKESVEVNETNVADNLEGLDKLEKAFEGIQTSINETPVIWLSRKRDPQK